MSSTLPLLQLISFGLLAQQTSISGLVTDGNGDGVSMASVVLKASGTGTVADVGGKFEITGLKAGDYTRRITALGYGERKEVVVVSEGQSTYVYVQVAASAATLDQVVVTGTMKAVSRANSLVPVEVYTAVLPRQPRPERLREPAER